jgi:spermidine synthase
MELSQNPANILVLGGGDGCIVREVLKYPSVQSVTLVDLDKRVTEIAQTHPVFLEMNQGSLNHPKVKIINGDAFNYLTDTQEFYDIIFVDFPDPKSVELSRLYSQEFYTNCYRQLRPEGLVITQAGSPYYATKAFVCIEKSMRAGGFATLPLHNQVLTLGEWGWIAGAKSLSREQFKDLLQKTDFPKVETRWINQESMALITSFGKPLISFDSAEVEVNSIHNPVLYRYYLTGNWDLY